MLVYLLCSVDFGDDDTILFIEWCDVKRAGGRERCNHMQKSEYTKYVVLTMDLQRIASISSYVKERFSQHGGWCCHRRPIGPEAALNTK